MTKSDKVLVILFRYLLGIGSLFALIPVVMPWSWMAATHRWLGLGEMPTGPIVAYLARSLSAFYALVGALCLVMASDLDRYRPLVRFFGVPRTARHYLHGRRSGSGDALVVDGLRGARGRAC